jgi:SAM-dependent methyltransferase
MRILDLGCGENKVEGATGLDNVALKGVDIVHDLLSFPYPIPVESYETIYLRHIIEHFSIENINLILQECHRILIPGGRVIICVPHVFSIAAFTDITHKSFFTFNSGKFWDSNYSKAYYDDINSNWKFQNVTCSVTWFDWKGKILRNIDRILSKIAEIRINYALRSRFKPSLADRIAKKYSFQFVEIKWTLKK